MGEEKLSDSMVLYWTNFAKSGNPNSPLDVQPYWPQYNATSDISMILSVPSYTKPNLLSSYCDFWDEMGYDYGV